MKTTHTQGEWYIERTSIEEEDFQGRILCKSSEQNAPLSDNKQIFIIVGESSKINGKANIHSEANAKLIASAPELLKALTEVRRICNLDEWPEACTIIHNAINKATS